MPSETTGRASPPTERVVAILDFLADHPDERFGVSELARRLGATTPPGRLAESPHLFDQIE